YSVAASTAPDPAVYNTAYASAAGASTVNDTDSVAIARNVSLALTKTFTDNSVDAGTGSHTFTLSVKNNGPSDAVALHLTDAVPARLNVTGFSDSPGVCSASAGQNVACTFDLTLSLPDALPITYSVAASTAPD